MIWLQEPPWIRWTLALLIAGAAVFIDLRGDGSIDHPFATEHIAAGDAITEANVEMRPVPSGLLEPVDVFGYATRPYATGEPITTSGVSMESISVEKGWWQLEVDVPDGSAPGDPVQLVLVDTGIVVPGRVTSLPSDDPLSNGHGSVAVPHEDIAIVAAAVAAGRVVVLVSAG